MAEPKKVEDFITSIAFPGYDRGGLEEFHHSTTFSRGTMHLSTPWISAYLSDDRAILETSRNGKNYFFAERVRLPTAGKIETSLSEALRERQTAKQFSGEKLSLEALSTLLHNSVHATRVSVLNVARDLRVFQRPYASGGGLYPIEIYVLLHNVEGSGVLVTHYDPVNHLLHVIRRLEDAQDAMSRLNDLDQRLEASGAVILLTSVFDRTTVKYGARGYRFALLEAGQIAQNLSLAASGMKLGTLPWGGAYDYEVAELLKVNGLDEAVMHVLAVGHTS